MFKLRFIITLSLIFLVFSMMPHSALAVGDVWPMWGHDQFHTNRSPANGPNSADLAWTYRATGALGEMVIGPDGTLYMPVYLSSISSSLLALNPNGTQKWIRSGNYSNYGTAVASDGTIYAVNTDFGESSLEALAPSDGHLLWSYAVGSAYFSQSTIGADGTIYIASDHCADSSNACVYAIKPNGTSKWIWDSGQPVCGHLTTPALAPNGDVYVNFADGCYAGLVHLSAAGQFIWSVGTADDLGQGYESPSVGSDGTVYMGSAYTSLPQLYAINPDGSYKWAAPVSDTVNSFEGANPTSAAISGDEQLFYTPSLGSIFGVTNGEDVWQYQPDNTLGGGNITLAANGLLYFTQNAGVTGLPPGTHGYVYALRASDGAFIWRYDVGSAGGAPVIGSDGMLYVAGDSTDALGTGNGQMLYAFRCADGLCAIPPHEALHTVTNLNDSGTGSLRQAVADSIYGDTIQFQTGLSGTMALASPITVGAWVTINGPAGGVLTLDGGDAHAVFNVTAGKHVVMNNLTIANGKQGIIVNGTLHISDMVFSSNDNPSGGAGALLVNEGANVSIDRSTFSNNTATNGGAIYNNGVVTISSSTFSNNQANSGGGAVFMEGGALSSGNMVISNSTFSGNSAFFGGALNNSAYHTTLTVINSTIAQNTASYGGGLYFVNFSGATTILKNTIVANNSGSNCDGVPTNGGGNLQYPGNSCGSVPVKNPLLAGLANNGGPTLTMAPQMGSGAIDAGVNSICAASPVNNLDQRGIIRPVDGDGNTIAVCDAGALEGPPSLNVAPTINSFSTTTPTLTWNDVSGASGYEIEVDTDKAFGAPFAFHDDTIPADQLYAQTTSLTKGVYFWRVRAKMSNGSPGQWSAIESFTIDIP